MRGVWAAGPGSFFTQKMEVYTMGNEGKTYVIRTVSDMHDIPEESMVDFLADLGQFLVFARHFDMENVEAIIDHFEWVDDGKRGLSSVKIYTRQGS